MKKFRRHLIWLVSVCILVSCMSFSAFADDTVEDWGDPDGDGVYYIDSVDDLYGFLGTCTSVNSFMKGKTVILAKDLDLNPGWKASSGTRPANVWVPLYQFSGTFDGQGHSISGLYVDQETYGSGFIVRANGATVKNLSILNSYFSSTSKDYIGSFASSINGEKAFFQNLYSEAIVMARKSDGTYINYAGGIVGGLYNGSAVMENVVFNGKVFGKQGVGGIAGTLNSDASSLSMIDCANYGTVSASGNHNGGLVGACRGNLSMTRCINAGSVSSSDAYSGALTYLESQNVSIRAELTDCYYVSGTNKYAVTSWHNLYSLTVKYGDETTLEFDNASNTKSWTDHTSAARNAESVSKLEEISAFGSWEMLEGILLPDTLALMLRGHMHEFDTRTVAPDCTHGGYTEHTCKTCGYSYKTELVQASGHTPGEWTVEAEPSTDAPGLKIRKCTVCGAIVESEDIPAIGESPDSSESQANVTEAPNATEIADGTDGADGAMEKLRGCGSSVGIVAVFIPVLLAMIVCFEKKSKSIGVDKQ
ncbi:MAG: hypothetical protein ACI3XQ_02735 [Eubacteriales bacterium]